ncbi:alpha/beta fold hydrolase [Microbacterium sp.]|uniref:alpha/beta fold hydrolase n=1 Tax=Microbacterium sp. TaxID=51671 RepID=UPI0039E55E23
MSARYRTLDVPVAGGDLRVGLWDAPDAGAPTIVAIHGVTSSHLAWQWLADALPEVRIVAPDLRGRGRSTEVAGPAGMAAHADDLAAVFDLLGLGPTVVVGHSMGAFVAVVFAHRHPSLVRRLVLVDGGLPLAAAPGLSTDELVAAILGPTAARLSLRFADTAAYLEFWRTHPAFPAPHAPELERYFAYDLVPDGRVLRPATSYATTAEDTVDLNGGTALIDALAALDAGAHPVEFVTVPRGLQDEEPGLYPPEHLAALLARHPSVSHERWDGLNHYSVVMSPAGAERVAALVRRR